MWQSIVLLNKDGALPFSVNGTTDLGEFLKTIRVPGSGEGEGICVRTLVEELEAACLSEVPSHLLPRSLVSTPHLSSTKLKVVYGFPWVPSIAQDRGPHNSGAQRVSTEWKPGGVDGEQVLIFGVQV